MLEIFPKHFGDYSEKIHVMKFGNDSIYVYAKNFVLLASLFPK